MRLRHRFALLSALALGLFTASSQGGTCEQVPLGFFDNDFFLAFKVSLSSRPGSEFLIVLKFEAKGGGTVVVRDNSGSPPLRCTPPEFLRS